MLRAALREGEDIDIGNYVNHRLLKSIHDCLMQVLDKIPIDV